MNTILEAIGRLAAFVLGAWMAYTEATGTYEFYLAEQGTFNYIVKAAVGVTLASVLLPYFTMRALKGRQWLLALATLIGLVLAVSVILRHPHRWRAPYQQRRRRCQGGAARGEAQAGSSEGECRRCRVRARG